MIPNDKTRKNQFRLILFPTASSLQQTSPRLPPENKVSEPEHHSPTAAE